MQQYDTVIRQVRIVDGSGHDPEATLFDVAITDGRIAAIAAEAADADTERAGAAAGKGDAAGDVEPAIAAAAAGRLDQDRAAARAERPDVAGERGGNRLGIAAAVAKAADAHAQRALAAIAGAEAEAAGDVERTVAAAAAQALHGQAQRIVAPGAD
ncbi:hypothetical protein, partial [Pseudomonas aeruginosa]|uniref:hypothetical protein n=1 Tax=Pseudomonas aeruginosa TaxID=287 RepID=UPI0034A197FA